MSSDPGSAARAPFGDAVVADVAAVAGQLLAALPPTGTGDAADRAGHRPRHPTSDAAPFPADALFALMADALPAGRPAGQRVDREHHPVLGRTWLVDRPRSLFFPAAGGLGFGLPAAVGVALADPARPVVAVLGDGAAQYGIAGLWTAAQLRLPVTFLVLRNGGYGALRGFVAQLGSGDAPGLDLPGLDAVADRAGLRGRGSAHPHREGARERAVRPVRGAGPPRPRGADHGGDTQPRLTSERIVLMTSRQRQTSGRLVQTGAGVSQRRRRTAALDARRASTSSVTGMKPPRLTESPKTRFTSSRTTSLLPTATTQSDRAATSLLRGEWRSVAGRGSCS